MCSSTPSPIPDKLDFEADLLFTEDSDPNSLFPYHTLKCTNPDAMNLFTTEDSSCSVFSTSQFTSKELLPCNSPRPPSTFKPGDPRLSSDVDELISPISKRGSIDVGPFPDHRTVKRRHTETSIQDTPKHSSLPNRDPRHKTSKRARHNLVERKYRDTLNAELERLRCAIPNIASLGGSTDDGGSHSSKPSKAIILASAVAYIRSMEGEYDRLNKKQKELQELLSLALRMERPIDPKSGHFC